MALHEQNRMLQILHKNGVCRKHISRIMNDLKGSGIFYEDDIEEDIDWELVDKKADILFSKLDPNEKLEEIKNIDIQQVERENESTKFIDLFNREAEKRVMAKIKEMEDKGLTGLDIEIEEKFVIKPIITRFGRSPLHEAVAMRDICLVKKYVKKSLYLKSVDNNGHTPEEMAYYEGYEEAVAVFDAHKNKK